MDTFTIVPFEGALPLRFGMDREQVISLLGTPASTHEDRDNWDLTLNVGYGDDKTVNHIGFVPGKLTIILDGKQLWTKGKRLDPNPILLSLDSPQEYLGFLIFPRLGVTTAGFHNNDSGDESLCVYPKGAWDEYLKKADAPDLSKYVMVK